MRSQLICKVCKSTFKIHKRFKQKEKPSTDLYCPHCHHKLYNWKEQKDVTIFKCGNKKCLSRILNLKKLNPSERLLQKLFPTHFKLNYQYREYHFTPEQIEHSKPKEARLNLAKIYQSDLVLGLVLTFYVSFSMSARKTAFALKALYDIHITGQTVLNYTQTVACYLHRFNLQKKGAIDNISVGDETYIKIFGKNHYVWLFISSLSRAITAYHLSDDRSALPAVAAMNEAIRTAKPDQEITFVTDGNPSYGVSIHFLNSERENKIKHIKVIGLENLDEVSTENRPYKQLIERLNRTFKQHIRPAAGFGSFNGAMSLLTLFVTYYNFMRPHMSLNYKTPVPLKELKEVNTMPAQWIKILSMAA
jgi:transposase-like protein